MLTPATSFIPVLSLATVFQFLEVSLNTHVTPPSPLTEICPENLTAVIREPSAEEVTPVYDATGAAVVVQEVPVLVEVNTIPLEYCTATSMPQVEEQAKNKPMPPGEVLSKKLVPEVVERYTAPEEVPATTVAPSDEQTMLVYQFTLVPYAVKLVPLLMLTNICPTVWNFTAKTLLHVESQARGPQLCVAPTAAKVPPESRDL